MAKKKNKEEGGFGVFAKLNDAAAAASEKQNSPGPIPEVKEKKEKLLVKTYNYKPDTLEIIKNLAYWERENIWEIIDKAVIDYAKNYEKKNGAIKARKK